MGRYIRKARFLLAASLFSLPAFNQTFTGTVIGRVVDKQQLSHAGVSVTLHDLEKDFKRRTSR
jgi:hypothetical protein